MTIRELGRQLRTRQRSCQELIRQTLDEIDRRDRFNSFITLLPEQAMQAAAICDAELARGIDRGPLHGIPYGAKDILYTKGVRTTGASRVYENFIPDRDAQVVELLHEAGAILVGKTNLHELAYGATSQSEHFGPVLNPRDPERIPGGSSGGSASAVAAGLLPMAIGTDTGGSIRIPASYCGVAGFMPTYDLVSRRGVMPLAFSLDHVGPLGSTIEDCALTMAAIAPRMKSPPQRTNLQGAHILAPENFFFERVDADVAAAVRAAIAKAESAGAHAETGRIPDIHEANLAARVIQLSEAAAIYSRHKDPTLFGADVWALIQQGRLVPAYEYVNAQRVRRLFREEFNAIWQRFDLMLVPATPVVAPRRDEVCVSFGDESEDTRMASTRLTRAIAFLGEPAACIPCGTARNGMPIGLQVIARPGADAALLGYTAELEKLLSTAS